MWKPREHFGLWFVRFLNPFFNHTRTKDFIFFKNTPLFYLDTDQRKSREENVYHCVTSSPIWVWVFTVQSLWDREQNFNSGSYKTKGVMSTLIQFSVLDHKRQMFTKTLLVFSFFILHTQSFWVIFFTKITIFRLAGKCLLYSFKL